MLEALFSLAYFDDAKIEIISGLAPVLGWWHLLNLNLDWLDQKVARTLASAVARVPRNAGDALEQAVAALILQDDQLMALSRPRLAASDYTKLWKTAIDRYYPSSLQFLIDNQIKISSKKARLEIMARVSARRDQQEDIVKILVKAWPRTISNFAIDGMGDSSCSWSAPSLWKGPTLRRLFKAKARLDREQWSDVFCWYNSKMFTDQVDCLRSTSKINWNEPNKRRQSFLEEVVGLMAEEDSDRLEVIKKLLEVGADPSPLLASECAANLTPEEKQILLEADKARKDKIARLEMPVTPLSLSTVLNLL